MKRIREKILARPWAIVAVLAVVAFAVAAVAGGTRVASAAPTFESERIPGVQDAPGFKWVSAEESVDGVAHYRVYNPLENPLQPGDNDPSHEACIGWWYFADCSHEHDFDGYLIRLDSDIDFSKYQFERDGGDPNQLSVGTEDLPFSGTFDGGGFTISNLTNERDGLKIQMDNGFFGWTNKATIKNINFKNCYIGGSYRDGLVAGYAQDTFFLNILCEDCTTSVIPANNVLNLVTNAGISGGTIAGVANGCTLYNCEMRAGRVVTNATAGVAALGGQPLYMGGLIGQANDTTVEYCRVTDKYFEDGTRDYAEVSGTYETAVSVANYSEVFVGGIVGGMQNEDTGTKIVDCYSTADVYGKAAIYFGVGLGLGVTRAYVGGIAGIVWNNGEGENLIEHVHYAGNLHSYQYNQLLLGIPIIQEDAYLAGIVSVGGDNVTIRDAYFNRSASSTDKEILAYQIWTTNTNGEEAGPNFGPRDPLYGSRADWESVGFDFAGGTLRNYGYEFTDDLSESEWTNDHYNKWAMDYDRGIPVHSGSVKATMDFPGSGTVTIGTTTLSDNPEGAAYKGWLTTDPYNFAVQGYTEGAAADTDEDHTIDVNYEFTTEKNQSWAADDQNEGFRFMGWYATRDVKVNNLTPNHSQFTTANEKLNTESGLFSGDTYLWQANEGDNAPDTLTVKYPETPDDLQKLDYADNDLYVAHAQAQVLLHSLNGDLVDTSGAADTNKNDDWYDYGGTITLPMSVEADGETAGNFIGWTNVANKVDESDKGYEAIGSETLNTLKNNGQFWNPGDTFTVTDPTNLYPVYSQYENIDVIYEGHDANVLHTRTGYGTAAKDPSSGDLILSVQPAEGSPILDGTVRFLGWYEYVGPNADTITAEEADKDTEPTHWLRVSRGVQEGDATASTDCFTFNVSESGADLTENHIYKARFEYRVDYWASSQAHNGDWEVYEQIWHRYGEQFHNIIGPDTPERAFLHWNECEVPTESGLLGCESEDAFKGEDGGIITRPHVLCAHHGESGGEQRFIAVTDFPAVASAEIETIYSHGATGVKLTATFDNNDVKPLFWSFNRNTEAINTLYDLDWENPLEHGRAGGFAPTGNQEWAGVAHVQARVTYHGIPGDQQTKTVWRVENELVKLDTDVYNKHEYYYGRGEIDGRDSLSEASPKDSDMSRSGYIFLGWLDMSDDDVKSAESLITNGKIGDSDAYLARSTALVDPYLMTGEETCSRAMDIYPVYAEFDLDTTTNIAVSGVDTTVYNVPADPSIVDGGIEDSKGALEAKFNADPNATVTETNTVELKYNSANEAMAKVTVDSDQKVWKDPSQGDDVYTFTSLSVYENDVLVETIPASEFTETAEGMLTTNEAILILVGHSYKFVANYSPIPVMVTYHLSEGSVKQITTEVGNVLPSPEGTPSFAGYDTSFAVGWTEGAEDGTPANYADGPVMLTPGRDLVTGTMHLWPVYREATIKVDSNIDHLTDMTHRGWNKTDDGEGARIWADQNVKVGDITYTFQGWSTTGADGTIVNTSTSRVLYGADRFPDPSITYTAIYEQVNEIRYHDTEGNVIYTASVMQDDPRTFVQEVDVEVPKLDEDGNLQYDENGNLITETQTQMVAIDSEAFSAIEASISQKNAAEGAKTYEQFMTWQWVSADGQAERWGEDADNDGESFINQTAVSNMDGSGHMDLYPVTVTLDATDAKGNAYTNLEAQLTLDDETNRLESANVTLLESYNQEWLKIHIDEVSYAPGSDGAVVGTETAQTGIPVDLYTPGSQLGTPVATATTVDEDTTVNEVSLVPGDALFTFSGRIVITKTATDEDAAGQVFSFTVTDGDGQARVVNVQMPNEATDGVYSKTVVLSVPFGSYTVVEDNGWAWRYDASIRHWELDTDDSTDGYQSGWVNDGKVTVEFDSAVSANNPDGVTSAVEVTNKLTNNKWTDNSDFKHNVMGTKDGE